MVEKSLAERQRENGTSAVQEMKAAGKEVNLAKPSDPLFPAPAPKPKEPRKPREIEFDFRMAKFKGKILKLAEDWKNDRDFQITLAVPSFERKGLKGLERFSGDEEMTFRVLPVQPRLDDKEPEEFGSKVPAFGVAMIERLERKAFEGMKGWEEMTISDIVTRTTMALAELPAAKRNDSIDKIAVDLANFAFFLWWNAKVAEEKKKRGEK